MANNRHSGVKKNGARTSGTEEKPSVFRHAKAGEKPRSDAGYFELMSFSILSAALGNRKAVVEKWPDIIFGFKNFHVQRVAEFEETDFLEVRRRVPLLQDKPQLQAVVANASAMMQISRVYGSFQKYLRSFEKDGPQELLKDMAQRFMQIDRTISQEFLKTAGENVKMPEPARPAKTTRPFRRRQPANNRQPRSSGSRNGPGKTQPARTPKQPPAKSTTTAPDKDKAKPRGGPARRRKFGWRKKKGSGTKAGKT